MASYHEQGVVFNSGENRLVGIATVPGEPCEIGVLILVGGPQYRVGSHRQFTLLARSLAESGIASFRFDYAGMGDSEGAMGEFHEGTDNITAALDQFQSMVQDVSKVVLWGLCDAASLAMIYAHSERRIISMILLNPWVHYGDYSPEVKLSHYYAPLLKGRETWHRVFTGKIKILSTLKEFLLDATALTKKTLGLSLRSPKNNPFVHEMLHGLRQFEGKVLFILSEQDLTAREFQRLIDNEDDWKRAVGVASVKTYEVAEADHTFSKKLWQDEVFSITMQWVKSL